MKDDHVELVVRAAFVEQRSWIVIPDGRKCSVVRRELVGGNAERHEFASNAAAREFVWSRVLAAARAALIADHAAVT